MFDIIPYQWSNSAPRFRNHGRILHSLAKDFWTCSDSATSALYSTSIDMSFQNIREAHHQ